MPEMKFFKPNGKVRRAVDLSKLTLVDHTIEEEYYDWEDRRASKEGWWITVVHNAVIIRAVHTGTEMRLDKGKVAEMFNQGQGANDSREGEALNRWMKRQGATMLATLVTRRERYRVRLSVPHHDLWGSGRGVALVQVLVVMDTTEYTPPAGWKPTGESRGNSIGGLVTAEEQVWERGSLNVIKAQGRLGDKEWTKQLEVKVLQYAMRKFVMTETERNDRMTAYFQRFCPEEGLIAKRQSRVDLHAAMIRAYRTAEDQFIEKFMKSTVVKQAKEQDTSVELAMLDWRNIAGEMSLAEALTLGDINNRYIRYVAVEVEPIDTTGKDDGLCFYELLDRALEKSGVPRQQRRAMMDQSRTEVEECSGRTHTAMLDSGAATVCISRKTVESLGIKVRKDPRALVVSGFQGGEDTTKEARMEEIDYVVCALKFRGVKMSTAEHVTERVIAVALVIDALRYSVLLGASLIEKHSVKDDGDMVSMFEGEKRMLISRVDWKRAAQQLDAQQIAVSCMGADMEIGEARNRWAEAQQGVRVEGCNVAILEDEDLPELTSDSDSDDEEGDDVREPRGATFTFHSNEEGEEDGMPGLLSDSDSDDDDARGGGDRRCMISAVAMSIQQGRIVPHYLSSSSDSEGERQIDPGKEWRLQLPPHPNDSICNPHSPKGRWHLRKMTDVEAIVRGLETSTQLIHWWTKIGRRRNILQACKDALGAGRKFDTKGYEAEIERQRRLVRTVKPSELEAFEEAEEAREQRESMNISSLGASKGGQKTGTRVAKPKK